MKSVVFSGLVACCLATTQHHHHLKSNATAVAQDTGDKASKIMDDVSQGITVAGQLEALLKSFNTKNGGSTSSGNQEFDLEGDDLLVEHKTHHHHLKSNGTAVGQDSGDKASKVMDDVSQGIDVAGQLAALLKSFNNKSGGSTSTGNQEFDLEGDDLLVEHKTHHHLKSNGTAVAQDTGDKASKIMDDISQGIDVAGQLQQLIKSLGGNKGSTSTGNQEFDLEGDDQLSHHHEHHAHEKKAKKDEASQIMYDISHGLDVADQIKNLFGHKGSKTQHHSGSTSQGNQEFEFEADNQFDKITNIMGDVSQGVDVLQQIKDLFHKKKHAHHAAHHAHHTASHHSGSTGQGNQEFDLQ